MSPDQKQKHQFWREHVSRADQYPGSIRSYCEAEKLSTATFQYWKSKFANERRAKSLKAMSNFVPVQVEGRVERLGHNGFPDPRWLAEFIIQLQRGLQ